MPDRLTEIEARLAALDVECYCHDCTAFYRAAPQDIAWLVAEVKRLRPALQNLVTKIDRSTTGPHAVSITDELAAAYAALEGKA